MTVYFGQTNHKDKITFFFHTGTEWAVSYININRLVIIKAMSYTTDLNIKVERFIPVEVPNDTILEDMIKHIPVELLL